MQLKVVARSGGTLLSLCWRVVPCPDWVAVKELKLSYQNLEAILFTVYPYYGNLN